MTLQQAIALIGSLFGILTLLVAAIWRRMEKRVDALESKLDTGQLAQFKAFDAEREKSWTFWRDDFMREFRESIKKQDDWRHEVLNPLLRQHGSDIDKMGTRLDGLERRITLIEGRHQ